MQFSDMFTGSEVYTGKQRTAIPKETKPEVSEGTIVFLHIVSGQVVTGKF